MTSISRLLLGEDIVPKNYPFTTLKGKNIVKNVYTSQPENLTKHGTLKWVAEVSMTLKVNFFKLQTQKTSCWIQFD